MVFVDCLFFYEFFLLKLDFINIAYSGYAVTKKS